MMKSAARQEWARAVRDLRVCLAQPLMGYALALLPKDSEERALYAKLLSQYIVVSIMLHPEEFARAKAAYERRHGK